MLTKEDIQQIKSKGMSEEIVHSQIDNFITGFPFMDIKEPATVSRGIIALDPEDLDDLIALYKSYTGRRMKFVPASGAATRMFKDLHEFISLSHDQVLLLMEENSSDPAAMFIKNLDSYAFTNQLKEAVEWKGNTLDGFLQLKDYATIIKTLLEADGLNYASMPKGLIPFHTYPTGVRTPLEEHLVEGAQYARTHNRSVDIHLTVSPEHREGFSALVEKVRATYEEIHGVEFNISFTEQKASTDTIAVDISNNPVRNSDGSLVFRPAGHGALLENLNDLATDIVFIKNIDNVAPDRLKPTAIRYKKALAGLLISYQSMVFDYLNQLMGNEELSMQFLEEVLDFTVDELCIIPPTDLNTANPQALLPYLISKLNRPIRVCGMVRNEGQPGGGPFWSKNPDGSTSLQIVESSQIDHNTPKQREIFESSTHFNPVDIVCGITDADGAKFDLLRYRDPNTGFISQKSKDGAPIKALELPGLWNGAMSDWITIFVEVPQVTFTPVKTVTDLLRDDHRGGE